MKEETEVKRLRDMTNAEICTECGVPAGVLYTNIVDANLSKAKIKAALMIIAKALSSTLGPDGATTILQSTDRQHLVTKDGLDVIDKMYFKDEVAQTVLELVKTISFNQVHKVGDGSTSAIIVANALYQEITSEDNEEYFKYASPKDIFDMLNTISDYLEEELKASATPLSDDLHELTHIASVAMNNSDSVGELVRKVYAKIGKFGFITPDITENYETDEIDYKSGISWKRGYIDPIFGLKYENHVVTHDKPVVFITTENITLESLDTLYRPLIAKVCGKDKKELLIVCNKLTDDARNFFTNVRELYKLGKQELFFTVVDMDQVTDISINNLHDLALLCGCEVFKKALYTYGDVVGRLDPAYKNEDAEMFLGHALKATITRDTTEIICDDSLLTEHELSVKQEFINKLNENLENLNKKSSLKAEETNAWFRDKTRKANLENLTAIIHVGGKTFEERRSRERLFEDAILASKSAIDYGYVVGGNIMIPSILYKDSSKITDILYNKFGYLKQNKTFFEEFVEMVAEGFLESYKAVLSNSQTLTNNDIESILSTVLKNKKFYNLKSHTYETFKDTKVINSVNTDIQIMKSCISLIGLLATSNQIITVNTNLDQVR